MTAIDGLPVLELADEYGVDHTCPLCDELIFDGFESGLADADLLTLRRCHDEIVSIDKVLRALARSRAHVVSSPAPRWEMRFASGETMRQQRVRDYDRSMQAAAAARERTVATMRWIIAGRPASTAAGADLWPARPKI